MRVTWLVDDGVHLFNKVPRGAHSALFTIGHQIGCGVMRLMLLFEYLHFLKLVQEVAIGIFFLTRLAVDAWLARRLL